MHKRLYYLSFTFVFLFQFQINAQNDTIWYDSNWNKTYKSYASYFRPTPKKVKRKYIIQDYYISGKIQMEGPSMRQDSTFFDGEVSHYFESGATQSIVNYKNGVPHGTATQFYENGEIRTIVPYTNGIENGLYKAYFEDGTLRGTIELKNNIRHGLYEEYYDNGNKMGSVIYSNGKPDGHFIEYYENGNMKYSSELTEGLLNGEVKTYNYDGELEHSGHFINNEKTGIWTSISNKDRVITRTYLNDTLHGEMTYKDLNDDFIIAEYYEGAGEYLNGELTSWTLKKTFDDDYKLFRKMTIENGIEVWRNYDDEGVLKSEISYGDQNIENGNWKFYYSNGQLKHDIHFVADDCYQKEYDNEEIIEIEETVIESTESYVSQPSGGSKPLIPATYLPDLLVRQEHFQTSYACRASANGDYVHYYDNGKPKLKAHFKFGILSDIIEIFDSSNKKTTININTQPEVILNAITVRLEEAKFETDYSALEPEPFDLIFYYKDYNGEMNIWSVIVHPILKHYISTLEDDLTFYNVLQEKLKQSSDLIIPSENFNKIIEYTLNTYSENRNNN